MYFTFSSLILMAIQAMARRLSVLAPACFAQMAPALAAVQRYRLISHSATSFGAEGVQLHQQETVALRRDRTFDMHVRHWSGLPGAFHCFELLQIASGNYYRAQADSSWQRWEDSAQAEPGVAELVELLQPLDRELVWTAGAEQDIRGQGCTPWTAEERQERAFPRRAILWISRAGPRPLELVTVSAETMVDIVTWEAWDDPSLVIPTC